jgi:hypothetical protein
MTESHCIRPSRRRILPAMADDPYIRITFRPLKSGYPVPVRVRRMVKAALRSQQLRCVAIEEVAAELVPKGKMPIFYEPSDDGAARSKRP